MSALSYAAAFNKPEIVNLLLSHPKIDVNSRDNQSNTPLHFSASCDCTAVTQLLLQRTDINPNIQNSGNNTPLIIAAEKHFANTIKLLLDDARVNKFIKNNLGESAWDYLKKDPRLRQNFEKKFLIAAD